MAKADTTTGTTAAQEGLMHHAIGLARRGLGSVWPNPSVGCVIARNGWVIGRGRTQNGGRPHAETQALAQAGARAEGADVYVTLEPCAHHGKTPPCADALIAARVGTVHIAMLDPDPRVNGQGAKKLQAAGINLSIGTAEEAARKINAGFLSRVQRNRPWITLKLATTLDGRIAIQSGESRWITGPAARRMTHALRSQSDAILVGRGTMAADDPMLDVRDMGPVPTPLRIILDSNLTLPPSSRLAQTACQIPTWVLTDASHPTPAQSKLQSLGVEVIDTTRTDAGLHLPTAMTTLAERGITRLLCEGGATLAASLLDAEIVDEIVLFQAGRVFGASGLGAIGALSERALAQMPEFVRTAVHPIGPDIVSIWSKPPPS